MKPRSMEEKISYRLFWMGFVGLICTTVLLSLIHISEPTRRTPISYAVFCLKKKKKKPSTQFSY